LVGSQSITPKRASVAPLAQEAKRALEGCREDLEAFVESVYEAADHGSADSAAS
jgi:hypothetical protein